MTIGREIDAIDKSMNNSICFAPKKNPKTNVTKVVNWIPRPFKGKNEDAYFVLFVKMNIRSRHVMLYLLTISVKSLISQIRFIVLNH